MITTLKRRIRRSIGFPVMLFCIVAVITALITKLLGDHLPESFVGIVSAEEVSTVLAILSGSMLTVTTFSVGVVLSALRSASESATPRTLVLLKEDITSRLTLAIFIGSFVFSVVGLIALELDFYGERGRPILFAMTIVVITIVVVALVNWVNHVTQFGLLTNNVTLTMKAARRAMEAYVESPCLGGRPFPHGNYPKTGQQISAEAIGFLASVETGALQKIAEEHHTEFYVLERPGVFVDGTVPLLVSTQPITTEVEKQAIDTLLIQSARDFDNDPEFGLIVLAEVASRALSPAVNDPGTALTIVRRSLEVFAPLMRNYDLDKAPPRYNRIFAVPIDFASILEDFFDPIARDGASLVEIAIAIQKTLDSLKRMSSSGRETPIAETAARCLERAQQRLKFEPDKRRAAEHAFFAQELNHG